MAETEINAPEPEPTEVEVILRGWWNRHGDATLVRELAADNKRIERGESSLAEGSRAALEHVMTQRGLPVTQPPVVRPVATPAPGLEIPRIELPTDAQTAKEYYAGRPTEELLRIRDADRAEKAEGREGLGYGAIRDALVTELAVRGVSSLPPEEKPETGPDVVGTAVGAELTPDGRPIVYVGIPSMESQEAWERDSKRRRATEAAGLEFSIRQSAFDRAYAIHQFDTVEGADNTRRGDAQRNTAILNATLAHAQKIEQYLAAGVVRVDSEGSES